MSEDGKKTKLEIIVRRAELYGEEFRRQTMEIIADGARNGRFNDARSEILKLEAAKRLYRDACTYVIRANDGNCEGLQEALQNLEPQFHPKQNNSPGRYGKPYPVDFAGELAKLRSEILEELEHGILDMGKNDQLTTTIVNQTGDNSVAVAAGSHSQVHVSVTYSKIAELIPQAMKEAQGLPIADDDRDGIIDHIQFIEDESKKAQPDTGRLKRIAKKIATDVGIAKDAAVVASGSVLGTKGIEALIATISNM